MTANLEQEFNEYIEKVYPTVPGHPSLHPKVITELKRSWVAAQLVLFLEFTKLSELPEGLATLAMDRLYKQIIENAAAMKTSR